MMDNGNRLDELHEECGLFGIYNRDRHDIARLAYYALYALQHRGQESAGIATGGGSGAILYHKDMGLVHEVFSNAVLNRLKGDIAIGHTRYSTTGASHRENAQPMVIEYKNGQMALAHNGNLINTLEIRGRLEDSGAIFQSTNDSEVILNLISRYRIATNSAEEAIQKIMGEVRGSYSLVIFTSGKLIGVRDPLGIKPLCIGVLGNSHVLASESCALDAIEAKFLRDVNPGEIVIISEDGLVSVQTDVPGESKLCIFEFIYFARPDSIMDGISVHQARIEAGERLAVEHPANADLVIGSPDSALTAALGFSMQSGIPYGQGLIRNNYIGRTFIQPEQSQRENSVRIKFNALRNAIEGRRIVMVEDSIVRGTTTRKIVQMLKDAGATEVHMRVSSPPFRFPCYFGVDISSKNQLAASKYSIEDIKNMIGADSLGYLSLEGLLKWRIDSKRGFCAACLDGNYPMEVPGGGWESCL